MANERLSASRVHLWTAREPNGSTKQRGGDLDAAAGAGVLNVREPKDAMTDCVTAPTPP
jgi:hypothetical protein